MLIWLSLGAHCDVGARGGGMMLGESLGIEFLTGEVGAVSSCLRTGGGGGARSVIGAHPSVCWHRG